MFANTGDDRTVRQNKDKSGAWGKKQDLVHVARTKFDNGHKMQNSQWSQAIE